MTIETEQKILFYDLETAPATAYVWGLWDQRIGINQIITHPRIIAYSAKWYGKKQVIFQSEYHDGQEEMLKGLHALLDEADIVIGWNSKSFDTKWVEGEFQLAGLTPPAPFHQVDLMVHFRRHSRFISKKLDYVSQRLLGESKVSHDGFEMWRACIEEDYDPVAKKKAWNLMRKYAKRDTALLEPIFEAVKGWMNLPILSVEDPFNVRCTVCGSLDIQWRGQYRTRASVYRRFQCQAPGCGKWGRMATREKSVGLARPL